MWIQLTLRFISGASHLSARYWLKMRLSLPVGWVINDSKGKAISDANCQLFPGINQAFGIPVIGTNKCVAPPQANNQNNILLKLAGIFITALAARQGAPFWFDILKRVVNLRGTGANPAEKEGK